MNAPRLYWRQRLNERDLFYRKPVREGADYIGRGVWPDWISRKAMWDDYEAWFAEKYAPVFNRLILGVDPEPVKNVTPTQFFDALRPYLYEEYTKATASTFPVTVQEFHRGRWINVVVRRKFLRVPPLELAEELYAKEKQRLDRASKTL